VQLSFSLHAFPSEPFRKKLAKYLAVSLSISEVFFIPLPEYRTI